jgi:hypothetical protein
MRVEQHNSEVNKVVLKSFQSSRAKGTNPRKKRTNPRAKGTNKRVNTFLATIEFFTSQYFRQDDHV